MVDILFIYCKLNPDLGYRQGMHELLAPILWVVDRDSVDAKPGSGTEGDLLLQLLDPTYIEHDAFALFCRIMQTARIYYEYSQQSTAGGQVDTIPIVDRCQHIHNDLLMAADPELGVHMQALEILPQIFLTWVHLNPNEADKLLIVASRWMRLLFGREFPFEDALLVWDLLFASGLEQDLVDFVCVAMLLRIRWQRKLSIAPLVLLTANGVVPVMNADHSSALSMLLRYHSPHPHAPQTFIHDALYLQQDLSPERGGFIISNYSGIPPEFLKKLSQPHVRPTAARKPIRDGFRDRSEGSSPARSPAGNEPRGFEGLLQDVSEEIQRRTETWGVAKAVRGAVTDARRNMHTMQWERPRATRPNDKSPFAQRDGRWTQEPKAATPDLKTRIELLEQRNKALAKLLGEALNDLRAQEGEVEGVDTSANDVMKKAVARVELIQICLEDSSIPVDTADLHSSENDAGPGTAQDEQPSTDKTDQPGRPAMASGRQQKDQAGSSKPDEPAISAPSRSAARPSLAESEFSWMLGRDRHLSGFASSASLPPEQTRHADSKTTANPLFGNGDEGQRRGSTESDVAMNSLRGRMAR